MRTPILSSLLVCLTTANAATTCAPRSVVSGPRQTPLIELYTSEGCSSCPPADRWLSGLANAGIKQQQAVALAFHVDYWDYIGWKDRFARSTYSDRQRIRVEQAGGSYVYTPQFLFNGRDWRGGNYSGLQQMVNDAKPAQAQLRLQTVPNSHGITVDVNAASSVAQRGDAVYLALFENSLSSQVAAGENNGALLHHDKVVRALFGPFPLDSSGHLMQTINVDFVAGQNVQNSGIAAWMENSSSGTYSIFHQP